MERGTGKGRKPPATATPQSYRHRATSRLYPIIPNPPLDVLLLCPTFSLPGRGVRIRAPLLLSGFYHPKA